MVFGHPEDFSPFVADLYSWWYRQRGIEPTSLVAESFILLEPWWMLRTGSVPFWMVFNVEPSAMALEHFLKSRTFESIHIMLFSHGVDSVGLVPIERWRAILSRARRWGHFVGVDERRYPRDFGIFVRYSSDLKKIAARYPRPGPLALEQLDAFLEQAGDRYAVRWLEDPLAEPAVAGASGGWSNDSRMSARPAGAGPADVQPESAAGQQATR